MNRLWAPWRKGYILKKPSRTCFICAVRSSSQDQKHFVLRRSDHSFALLNIYPYNNGHVMVMPKRHVGGLGKLKDHELLDLLHLTNAVIAKLGKVMKPDGMNVGMNFGRAAGAGVPGHVHIHVVARWFGDTNFMPVVGNTKIISESLKSVYERLKWGRPKK